MWRPLSTRLFCVACGVPFVQYLIMYNVLVKIINTIYTVPGVDCKLNPLKPLGANDARKAVRVYR